jgi:hypothetical protein
MILAVLPYAQNVPQGRPSADLKRYVQGFTKILRQGFAQSCRDALRMGPHPATAPELRKRLSKLGRIGPKTYENALAVIHTTVKRLAQRGEVKVIRTTDGKPAYQWVGRHFRLPEFPQPKRRARRKARE